MKPNLRRVRLSTRWVWACYTPGMWAWSETKEDAYEQWSRAQPPRWLTQH